MNSSYQMKRATTLDPSIITPSNIHPNGTPSNLDDTNSHMHIAPVDDDILVLYDAPVAILYKYPVSIPPRDYDSCPRVSELMLSQSSMFVVSRGHFQIYKILGKTMAYIRCGSMVHPILPKMRLWKILKDQYILPQPSPQKYWRLEVPDTDTLDELDEILKETCYYQSIYVPPPPPPPSPPPQPLHISQDLSLLESKIETSLKINTSSSYGNLHDMVSPVSTTLGSPEKIPENPSIVPDEPDSILDEEPKTPEPSIKSIFEPPAEGAFRYDLNVKQSQSNETITQSMINENNENISLSQSNASIHSFGSLLSKTNEEIDNNIDEIQNDNNNNNNNISTPDINQHQQNKVQELNSDCSLNVPDNNRQEDCDLIIETDPTAEEDPSSNLDQQTTDTQKTKSENEDLEDKSESANISLIIDDPFGFPLTDSPVSKSKHKIVGLGKSTISTAVLTPADPSLLSPISSPTSSSSSLSSYNPSHNLSFYLQGYPSPEFSDIQRSTPGNDINEDTYSGFSSPEYSSSSSTLDNILDAFDETDHRLPQSVLSGSMLSLDEQLSSFSSSASVVTSTTESTLTDNIFHAVATALSSNNTAQISGSGSTSTLPSGLPNNTEAILRKRISSSNILSAAVAVVTSKASRSSLTGSLQNIPTPEEEPILGSGSNSLGQTAKLQGLSSKQSSTNTPPNSSSLNGSSLFNKHTTRSRPATVGSSSRPMSMPPSSLAITRLGSSRHLVRSQGLSSSPPPASSSQALSLVRMPPPSHRRHSLSNGNNYTGPASHHHHHFHHYPAGYVANIANIDGTQSTIHYSAYPIHDQMGNSNKNSDSNKEDWNQQSNNHKIRSSQSTSSLGSPYRPVAPMTPAQQHAHLFEYQAQDLIPFKKRYSGGITSSPSSPPGPSLSPRAAAAAAAGASTTTTTSNGFHDYDRQFRHSMGSTTPSPMSQRGGESLTTNNTNNWNNLINKAMNNLWGGVAPP